MSETAFKRLKTALEEVRDFYAGKGGPMKFHVPDGKGGFTTRELTHEQYCAEAEALATAKGEDDGTAG